MKAIPRWKTGTPPDADWYLLDVGDTRPDIDYWDGKHWKYYNGLVIGWDYLPQTQ